MRLRKYSPDLLSWEDLDWTIPNASSVGPDNQLLFWSDQTLFRTLDGGINRDTLDLLIEPDERLLDVREYGRGMIIAQTTGMAYISYDEGSDWSVMERGTWDTAASLPLRSPHLPPVVMENGGMYDWDTYGPDTLQGRRNFYTFIYSTDRGRTWERSTEPILEYLRVTSIAVSPAGTLLIGTVYDGIYRSKVIPLSVPTEERDRWFDLDLSAR